MRSRALIGRAVLLAVTLCVAAFPAFAEEVEKKFRFGIAAGGFNHLDAIESDSANQLDVLNPDESLFARFFDPRNDAAVFGKLDIQAAPIGTMYGQYAVNRFFLVEVSVGYQKADVGDAEVQAFFDGDTDFPDVQDFNFRFFRVPVGEIERVPIQLTGLVRFRPKANFNPYLGVGVGYSIIGFEPTDEFNELSRNLDASQGQSMALSSSFPTGSAGLIAFGDVEDLQGATVDARDSFEWHIAGGAELTVKRNWSLFVDLRWTFASRSLSVGFNGAEDLGVSVPNFTDFAGTDLATQAFGGVLINQGGLIDGGRVGDPFDDQVDCSGPLPPASCTFLLEPDGELDTGIYYVQGGNIDYGGVGLQFGFRYSF